MPVLNKHHLPNKQIPHGAIYIGRGSVWGNPYPIGEKYGDRAAVLKLYREYLDAQLSAGNISKRELAALKGQSLVCYCKPAPCHGDILLEYADKAYAELNPVATTQKETVKLIVAGSRTYQDVLTANIILDQFKDWVESKGKTLEIVSGMATGPDMFGFDYANKKGIPVHKFYADWNGQGKSAGYARNVAMGNFGDHLIAFWDGQSRGTNHMINYMKGLNKPVTVIKG